MVTSVLPSFRLQLRLSSTPLVSRVSLYCVLAPSFLSLSLSLPPSPSLSLPPYPSLPPSTALSDKQLGFRVSQGISTNEHITTNL